MIASPANFIDRLFFGYQNAAALKAAVELDVFTAIGEGSTDMLSLAVRCKAAQPWIVALCDSLVVMAFLTKSSERYALSADAAAFLDRRSPMCIAGIHDFLAAPEFVALVFQDPRAVRTPRILTESRCPVLRPPAARRDTVATKRRRSAAWSMRTGFGSDGRRGRLSTLHHQDDPLCPASPSLRRGFLAQALIRAGGGVPR
jgi:hypothetical protein